ncbi:GIY-YIG nuclease family protein [Acetobacterium sp.]|uniref:GIY-YIG nuclease family protein n=1 Tax=Acetobacterium sp. TaxID=1872094 RepID=UPI00271C1B3D|nr:GIY-YIG nuclease family protein [Acetobacterium sp.]MDO9493364.1 GIY-YIG nuclease family protein [Acetobacterium sp.]
MSHLEKKLNQIPPHPGVYKMLDSTGRIIYVGKSKCLKKRVKSYFTKSPKQPKIERMIFFIDDIDYIVTDTHLEARLLECQLIKEIQPYFNSQMKNDRRYFYLKVTNSGHSKGLSIVPEREDHSFGPFRRKQVILSLIDMLTHLFPIIQENNSFNFHYHTLPELMSPEDFLKNRQTLIRIFSEDTELNCFINQLQICMHKESAQYHYERATTYRDLINSLAYISHNLHAYKHLTTRDILLKIPVRDGEKLFYISKSKIIQKKYFPTLSQTEIEMFLAEVSKTKAAVGADWDEKTEVDFQNILFSEIQALPDDWILIK